MLKQFVMVIAMGLALMNSTFGVAQDLSPESYKNAKLAYENSLGAWQMPDIDSGGCFKSYCLGQKLNLADKTFGYYSPDENITSAMRGDVNNERIFHCKRSFLNPILTCRVSRRNTAFEQDVEVQLTVLTAELPIPELNIGGAYANQRNESIGRIIGIHISAERANVQLFEVASAYFEKIYGRKGVASKQVTTPQDGYSDKCKKLARMISAKRPIDVSVGERSGISKCDADSMEAFLGGKYSSTLIQNNIWNLTNRGYVTGVTSKNRSTPLSGTNLVLENGLTSIVIDVIGDSDFEERNKQFIDNVMRILEQEKGR